MPSNPLPVNLPAECRKAQKIFQSFVDRTLRLPRTSAFAHAQIDRCSRQWTRSHHPSVRVAPRKGLLLHVGRQSRLRLLRPRRLGNRHRPTGRRDVVCAVSGRYGGRWSRLPGRRRGRRIPDHPQFEGRRQELHVGRQYHSVRSAPRTAGRFTRNQRLNVGRHRSQRRKHVDRRRSAWAKRRRHRRPLRQRQSRGHVFLFPLEGALWRRERRRQHHRRAK